MQHIMQGLWIGSALSVMEQLSIASFLTHGHAYHLYMYDEVQNIPKGTVIQDANSILPSASIFQYKDYQTYAPFANIFRYKLLLEKGGWWVDTDTICLKPFSFDEAYVFATEWHNHKATITNAIIKAPAASEVMAYAWHVGRTKNPAQLVWGETGPQLLDEAVKKFSLAPYVKYYTVFCPLSYSNWLQVIEPHIVWQFDATTHAIHLWNEMWRRNQCDKNQRYHPECLYEQLKRRYL
jgi:mannosyltransferase OCH1-like enzyme